MMLPIMDQWRYEREAQQRQKEMMLASPEELERQMREEELLRYLEESDQSRMENLANLQHIRFRAPGKQAEFPMELKCELLVGV